jgi:hypothetical protein
MPAKIGQDQLILRSEGLRRRQPELVMNRKRMQQEYRRPAAENRIEQFRVIALDARHDRDLNIMKRSSS